MSDSSYLLKVTVVQLVTIIFTLILLTTVSTAQSTEQEVINYHLTSDAGHIDGKKGTIEYIGNALYQEPGLTLTADRLIGKKDQQGRFSSLTAIGSPAVFTQTNIESGDIFVLKADNIVYLILSEQLTADKNALLKQVTKNKDSIQINAQQIKVNNESQKSRTIKATGHPLTLSILEKGKKDLAAEASQLAFTSSNSDLELTGNVVVKQEHGTISAGTFKYNRETKISSFEKSSNEQVEIIQKQKKP